jgi:hypothetical protein
MRDFKVPENVDPFPNIQEMFVAEVETLIMSNNSVVDSIVAVAKKYGIDDFEFLVPILDRNLNLKAALQGNFEDLHFIKRAPRLPI